MTMSKQDLEIEEWKNLLDYVNYIGIFVVEPNPKKKEEIDYKESKQWINNMFFQYLVRYAKIREETTNPNFTQSLVLSGVISLGNTSTILQYSRFWEN